MSALVLQAVLRETEAVAYCHWIQVWAEREQVGIADLSRSIWYSCDNSELHCTLLKVDLLIRYLDFSFPPKSSLQLVI